MATRITAVASHRGDQSLANAARSTRALRAPVATRT